MGNAITPTPNPQSGPATSRFQRAKRKALAGTLVAASFIPNPIADSFKRAIIPDAQQHQSLHAEELAPRITPGVQKPPPPEKVDIFKTQAWSDFQEHAKKVGRDDLIEITKDEIVAAKEYGTTDKQLEKLITYGLKHTIPEAVAYGLDLLSVQVKGEAAIEPKDIKQFFTDVAEDVGQYDRYKDIRDARKAHYAYVLNKALNKESGFVWNKMATTYLGAGRKHLTKRAMAMIADDQGSHFERDLRMYYLGNNDLASR